MNDKKLLKLHFTHSNTFLVSEYCIMMYIFVANEKFLFGSRPSIADFALYGQLVTLMHDLTPGTIMRAIAPRTIAWLMRLADTSGVDGAWIEYHALPKAIEELLIIAGRVYLPYLRANAKAIETGTDNFTTLLNGHRYTQPVFKYHIKCRNFLVDQLDRLNKQDRNRLRTLLGDTGCLQALMETHAN